MYKIFYSANELDSQGEAVANRGFLVQDLGFDGDLAKELRNSKIVND